MLLVLIIFIANEKILFLIRFVLDQQWTIIWIGMWLSYTRQVGHYAYC